MSALVAVTAVAATGAVVVGKLPTASAQTPTTNTSGETPFQKELIFSINAGSSSAIRSFTVPAGQRLQIKWVSGFVRVTQTPSGTDPAVHVSVDTTLAGNRTWNWLPPVRTGPDPTVPVADLFLVSEPMKAYADGGTHVHIQATRSKPAGSVGQGFVRIAVVGVLSPM
jgi:hypothetical protein